MTTDEFVALHPLLFHIAEGGSWESIKKFGLESTSALLDRFGVSGQERDTIESRRRDRMRALNHEKYGTVMIRDQSPISESKLAQCLNDMTTAEWYRMLNGYVFLWPSCERRDRMLASYEDRQHDVLTIDSQKLLALYQEKIMLSPINSGNTQYDPAKRGRWTFVPFGQCRFSDWRRRKRKKPEDVIAEVTLPYRLLEVEVVVRRVESYSGSQRSATIWESQA